MRTPLLAALGPALLVTAALSSCDPLPIRCRVDTQCPGGMRCDARQGLCADEGAWLELSDGGSAWAGEGGDPGGGGGGGEADAGNEGSGDGGQTATDAGMCPGGCGMGQVCDNGDCVDCNASAQCPITAPCCSASARACVTGVSNCL